MAKRSGTMGEAEQEAEQPEPQQEESPPEEEVSQESDQEDEEELDGPDPDQGVSLESLDPEEALWEGGPLVKQLLDWKAQYGEIYLTYFTPTVRVVWRPLSRADYRRIVARMGELASEQNLSNVEVNMVQEELVTQIVMLWPGYDPNDDANELGGLASTISQHAMEASGFSAMEVRQL